VFEENEALDALKEAERKAAEKARAKARQAR
jgi:hypothetical protein